MCLNWCVNDCGPYNRAKSCCAYVGVQKVTEGNFSVIVCVIKIFGDNIIRSSTRCYNIYHLPALFLSA